MSTLIREAFALCKRPLEGFHVRVNEADLTTFDAFLEGPQETPFEGHYFRIQFVIPKEYPQSPPIGLFKTRIFHPNISDKGEICVNTLQHDWDPKFGLKHILMSIKSLLISPNPESVFNQEAGKLLLENYKAFKKRAQIHTKVHGIKYLPPDIQTGCTEKKEIPRESVQNLSDIHTDGLIRTFEGTEEKDSHVASNAVTSFSSLSSQLFNPSQPVVSTNPISTLSTIPALDESHHPPRPICSPQKALSKDENRILNTSTTTSTPSPKRASPSQSPSSLSSSSPTDSHKKPPKKRPSNWRL
eukprot:TRINITY_DN4188_c0_g3_i1.p1 TRINITY_DN4188_c0_g3~~TRINITY_DN4188_c0_g3_i1.p1  ORF type:complete len:300 (+),score=35.35 TRINITY_DN4188_c0_g3_i1:136-1035(+)